MFLNFEGINMKIKNGERVKRGTNEIFTNIKPQWLKAHTTSHWVGLAVEVTCFLLQY